MKAKTRTDLLKGAQRFEDLLKRDLKDPVFRQAFEEFYLEAEVAERLYKLRGALRMTQKQLASRARMQQNAVSRIEKGENSLTLRTVQKVATALGYRVVLDFIPLRGSGIQR